MGALKLHDCVRPAQVFLRLAQGLIIGLELVPFIALGREEHLLAGLAIRVPAEKLVHPMGPMRDDVLDRCLVFIAA